MNSSQWPHLFLGPLDGHARLALLPPVFLAPLLARLIPLALHIVGVFPVPGLELLCALLLFLL
eukprot:6327051-Ditylum_brightwellii.AAC.1